MLTSSAEQHFKFKKVEHGLFCFYIQYIVQPGGSYVNPLQYSFLENPLKRSPVVYSPQGCKKSDVIKVT